ncbi:hypothetical protein Bpfe_010853, partial [Biomphalaria pfeifferi]
MYSDCIFPPSTAVQSRRTSTHNQLWKYLGNVFRHWVSNRSWFLERSKKLEVSEISVRSAPLRLTGHLAEALTGHLAEMGSPER